MELSRGIRFLKRIDIRLSLFAKLNGLLLVLFIPIIILYSYSNNVTFHVVSQELQMSNTKQLSFLSSQIDSRVQQMMDFSLTFSRDPNVRKFNGLPIVEDPYDKMQTRYAVQEKIYLQSGVQNIWPVEYAVYSQNNKDVISNINPSAKYDEHYLKNHVSNHWVYRNAASETEPGAFYWYMTDSFDGLGKLGGSNLVIEASFGEENIQNMLDNFKAGGHGDPFFYHADTHPILNRSAEKSLAQALIRYLEEEPLQDTTQRVVKLGHKKYLVSAVKSPNLNWYVVDYVPLEQVLRPISISRNLFYISMLLLFLVGISASILLYQHVQRPIKKLIKGLHSVRRGDYSVRINSSEKNEFSFLYRRFNEMSRQIQELIENVLTEKLRAREATLKQLQAQINPHFLYNCLGFIINMAQMKDEHAVVSMAYNLSAYYRYTTRLEKETASVKEEIQLLVNYLDIQKLRNGRIHYHIDIPEEMADLGIPRLMLQPIVENAVLHGVGKTYSSGEIRISGQISRDSCQLWIDDDGQGMSAEVMEVLNRRMRMPLQEEMGCGLWNVYQRLFHEFGDDSRLSFTKSPLGGLRAALYWKLPSAPAVKQPPIPNMRGAS